MREVRRQTKAAIAALSGKQRGPDHSTEKGRKVPHRGSVDVADRRAQVWHRIGDGSEAAGLAWGDAKLKTAEDMDEAFRTSKDRRPWQRAPLGDIAIKLLKRIVRQFLDFKSGRCEVTLDKMQEVTGHARSTICRALSRLREHGFINWVRRSHITGRDELGQDIREQTSNAYFFDLQGMASNVRQHFINLLAERRRRAAAKAAVMPKEPRPEAQGPLQRASDPELNALLIRIGEAALARESAART